MNSELKIKKAMGLFNSLKIKQSVWFFSALLITVLVIFSCNKESDTPDANASNNLAIDSLVATKTNLKIWEKTYITAYTRGKNLQFQWKANHGSMEGKDSITVTYWACPSCVGLNTIECKVTNEFGSITDTIMINIHK